MNPLPRPFDGARALLPLCLAATLAACGSEGGSGGGGPTIDIAQGRPAGPTGTIPTASTAGGGSTPASEPTPLFDDAFDESIADLDTVADVLRDRVLRAGASALVSLNRDYASGTLGADVLDCIATDWPTTGYFCGEDLKGERIATAVAPVASFAYGDAPACLTGLSESLDVPTCTAQFVEALFGTASSVRYRLGLDAGNVVEMLEASLGAESLVGAELDGSLCVVEFRAGDIVGYSDEAVCDARLREALRGG